MEERVAGVEAAVGRFGSDVIVNGATGPAAGRYPLERE